MLAEHGLGQVLDIVPNHMAIGGRRNTWWWDVLENGPSSRYASYFDCGLGPAGGRLRNTVLLPVLGDHYGRVLEAGRDEAGPPGGKFEIHYHEHVFPCRPARSTDVLGEAAERCRLDALAFSPTALGRLPRSPATDQASASPAPSRQGSAAGHSPASATSSPRSRRRWTTVVDEVNADADALDVLLERQNYRLAFWRTAGQELGYRRFFDINTLVGLRTEDERGLRRHARPDPPVARDGVLDGVRIDHPDGLRDPSEYFRRCHAAGPHAWIVAEKILQPGERLPDVVAGGGHDWIRLPQRASAACSSTRLGSGP